MQPGPPCGYFPGGASGGILPASLAELPLDFLTPSARGCFIGSAAIVVFSQHDQARLLAENAMRFFARESCGQCTPCRVGCSKAAELMRARPRWDGPLLQALGRTLADASICGLSQAAPNPMNSVLRYFAHEVGATAGGEGEAHERRRTDPLRARRPASFFAAAGESILATRPPLAA